MSRHNRILIIATMPHSLTVLCLFTVLLLPFTRPVSAAPTIVATDDNGMQLSLAMPARRIISLSPHITEILFALGAGARIVGTTAQSNYPEAARQIQRIGDYQGLDIEAIVALQPDLIISWPSGNPQRQLQTLKQLGLPLFASDPQRLKDIPGTIQNLGRLTGTDAQAARLAADFQRRLQALRDRYRNKAPVAVFVQLWAQPLITVNDRQLISDVIQLCGGRNVFGDLAALAPHVSTEAVLQANPDVIITTAETGIDPPALSNWHRWPALKAIRTGQLYGIDPLIISRPTPDILDGATRMCRILERSRALTASP